MTLPLEAEKKLATRFFMKKQNRIKAYKLRLTEAEMELFKKKAERYTSLSAMVRVAVEQLDSRASKKKIDILDEFGALLHQQDVLLSHLSGNFNQAVKRANQLSINKQLSISFFEKKLFPQIEDIHKSIIDIKKTHKAIFRQLLNL